MMVNSGVGGEESMFPRRSERPNMPTEKMVEYQKEELIKKEKKPA